MRSSHTPGAMSAVADEANLLGFAGLVPLVRLAERVGVPDLLARHLHLGERTNSAGAHSTAKAMGVIAGMCAGADSIEDLRLLRHGAMSTAFDALRAPSTYGQFLRAFTFGHNRQLGAVHRRATARLAREYRLLPGAATLAFVDIDPTHITVFGTAKQGAQIGRFKGRRTLHPILSTITTPASSPILGPVRLRQGKSADVRGAAGFVAEALGAAREAGCTGRIIVRGDAKFHAGAVVAACRRAGAHFSFATGINPSITRAIACLGEVDWIRIEYPKALPDPETGESVSIAEISEVPYTAFAADPRHRVTARLIVRRVVDLAKPMTEGEQGRLFPVYRYHPIFTDSPYDPTTAEHDHRRHAIIEPQIADLKHSALSHLPSGRFEANHAWLILAALAHNLQRAAGVIAGGELAAATTATLRARLIAVPARLARSARTLTLHLPTTWPWSRAWQRLFDTVHAPPATTTDR